MNSQPESGSTENRTTTRSWLLPAVLGVVVAVLIGVGFLFVQKSGNTPPAAEPATAPSPVAVVSPMASPLISPSPDVPQASPSPAVPPGSPATPDLTIDANGLSKATVTIQTNYGPIKFKFYPKDAPTTVNRMIELIRAGFYNGLIFHRVVPGFVIQGGDPTGTGAGGSGQKLKAEFNRRRHIEGAVAMARAVDPDSADSQFYISLGTHPHLDNKYTVFGQVTEGIDIVRKIKMGDKMLSVTVE